MPRVAASVIAVALGAAVAVAVASCGEDDAKLLAGSTAQEISENLDTVKTLANEGECVGAEDEALQVTIQVESIKGIDPELKRALEEGAEQLNEVVDTCEAPEVTSEETLPAPAESPEKAKAEKEAEKEAEKAEKEEEKAEKEAEKEQKDAEKEQEKAEKEAEKEQKETEKEQAKEESGGESSGGIGPGGEAGGAG